MAKDVRPSPDDDPAFASSLDDALQEAGRKLAESQERRVAREREKRPPRTSVQEPALVTEPPGKGASALAGGFAMSVLPGTRAVPGYPVTKDELERLGDAQTQSQMFSSLCAFFASFALSTFLDGTLAMQLTPAGEVVNTLGPWLFGLVAIAFGVLAWDANRRRRGMIDRIVGETKHDPQS